MVLEQASLLTEDPVVRFAALMHDVGKGAIPKENWPNLQGHEELGVELINSACKRIKAPNDYRELAKMTSLYHTRCHRADRHGAEEILLTLELTDAFRKPQRFAQFLLACEADSRGRLGLENVPYPQTGLLNKVLAASNQVNARQFVEQGFQDAQIGEQVRLQRLELISQCLSS